MIPFDPPPAIRKDRNSGSGKTYTTSLFCARTDTFWMPTRDVLRVWLLGQFRVAVGSRFVGESGWRLRKAKSLVKLLALTPGQRLHRGQAIDLLWPHLEPETAAHNLHQTIYIGRRVLHPGGPKEGSYLHLRGELLILSPEEPPWIDVEAFEIALGQARGSLDPAAYRAALDLYAGELLPEDRYEDWTRDRREALRQDYLSLLLDLAGLYHSRQEHGRAIETLQKLLAEDPAREEAHRGLMSLYALIGDRQRALRQYQILEENLRRELEVEPAAESKRLYEDIRGGHVAPAILSQPTSKARVVSGPRTRPQPGRTAGETRGAVNNLPIPLTSFVGRARALADVKLLLTTTRLLTLTGVGGCGKTRLALEVAGSLLDQYPDGVWLVGLAGLAEPELVPEMVASVLGVREKPGRPLVDVLAAYLKPRHLLFVFDNCEHLIAACAQLADTLLRSCPYLRILATSREPLRVPGELTWRVPSLSVPDPYNLPPLEDVSRFEAIELFANRAQAVAPDFVVTDDNAAPVAQVCYRLDGIPLAIELAAAQVRALSVVQLAARLDDCFRLLTGGSRTALPRHQTMKATLDWSYELLSEPERVLFRRLAVFAGGFTLEAAEAVCSSGGVDTQDLLDLLIRLVDKSLVVLEEKLGEMRYRLLEPIRQYGRARLAEAGELTTVRNRHLDWCLRLAERALPGSWGPDQVAWLNRLEAEQDNLRAALELAQESDPEGGLQLAARLSRLWLARGSIAEHRAWTEALLAKAPRRTEARARALRSLGHFAIRRGDLPRARSLLQESQEISRELDDKHGIAWTRHRLGEVALYEGDYVRARTLLDESLALSREIGDRPSIYWAVDSLGHLAQFEGDYERAGALYEESLTLRREAGDRIGIGFTLDRLGNLARAQGDYARAKAFYRQGLALRREIREREGSARCLSYCGILAVGEATYSRGVRLLGAAEIFHQRFGSNPDPDQRAESEACVAAARAALGEEAFARAWADGQAMTLEQAIEEAFAYCEAGASRN